MTTPTTGGWPHGQLTHAMLVLTPAQLAGLQSAGALAPAPGAPPVTVMPLAGYVHGLHVQDLLMRDGGGEWWRLPAHGAPYPAPASDLANVQDRWLAALLDAGPWVIDSLPADELEPLLWSASLDGTWPQVGNSSEGNGWACRIGRFVLVELPDGAKRLEHHDSEQLATERLEELEQAFDPPPMEPDEEDYVLAPAGQLGARTSVGQENGGHVGTYDSQDDALDVVVRKMDADGFWPNVWLQDDHGGLQLCPPSEIIAARARVGVKA